MTTVSPQEAFDIVWNTMREQDMPAFEADVCFMRTPSEGLKCAFGALLTDDEASDMPNMRIHNIEPARIPERLRGITSLLIEMQDAHDEEALSHDDPLSTWTARFQRRMITIANRHELVVPA